MRWLAVLAVAGCASQPAPKQPLTNASGTPAPAAWRITSSGLGPLGSTSEATEAALRVALPSVTITTTDLGGDSGIVFDVFDGAEKLFYVVPDEEEADDGADRRYAKTIFSIFATSPRVSVDGQTWRVGSQLEKADGLVRCECWGDGEVTACATAANLSVIFEERCEPAEANGPSAMVGRRVGRIMWKRVAED